MFILRQVFEKYHEYSIDLYNIFVDYTQAFDSVNRNKTIESLMQYDILSKIIRLIGLTLTNRTAKVKINNQLTENFSVEIRVKQGDPLSATLFTVVIDNVLKQMDLRGNISTRLKRCSAYADDIPTTTRTKQTIIDTFQKLGSIVNENNLIEEERIILGNKS
jgi:hypothetical protein